MKVTFAVIFQTEGTDQKLTRQFFMDNGAEDVAISDDYVIVDDTPGKAITFFVKGMELSDFMTLRLKGLKLEQAPGLPEWHFMCVE